MEWQHLYDFITKDLPIIVQAILAIVGALKIISRYTPFKWDDRVFDALGMFSKPKPPEDDKGESDEPPIAS